jgi:hypothetical protein
MMPEVVPRIATRPRSFAAAHAAQGPLALRALPVELPPIEMMMTWLPASMTAYAPGHSRSTARF